MNGCYYNQEVDDLTTVYLSGFYDGEKKWKDKIKNKIERCQELFKEETNPNILVSIRIVENEMQSLLEREEKENA